MDRRKTFEHPKLIFGKVFTKYIMHYKINSTPRDTKIKIKGVLKMFKEFDKELIVMYAFIFVAAFSLIIWNLS